MARGGIPDRVPEPRSDDLRRVLWLLAISFALHEAEEWNIVAWQRATFTPAPEFDELGARVLLVLFALLGVGFTAAALTLLRMREALFALLPLFVAVVLGNALTHVGWQLAFGGYAPGVVTSAVLLVPLTAHLVYRVLRERLVRACSRCSIACSADRRLAAGRTLSAPQLALQRLGARAAASLEAVLR
jgi:hypothetical protein